MLLLCDIGNSITKFAFLESDKVNLLSKSPTSDISTEFLKSIRVSAAAITSVVPDATKEVTESLQSQYEITPYIASSISKLNFVMDYDTPETLGSDRICNISGAVQDFNKLHSRKLNIKNAVITVDFGTATTVNVLLNDFRFKGGMILPGIDMMLNSLNSNTAQLPKIAMTELTSDIGASTKYSIASGVTNATVGAIKNLENVLSEQYEVTDFYYYLSGGKLKFIEPFINFNHKTMPDLTFRGLKKLYELNNPE